MKETLGILAAVIVIVGTIPYLRDVLRGSTRPARSTWTLLTILLVLDLLVQHDIGVGWAIALTAGEVLATGSVFILALKYGVGGLDKADLVSYALWVIMVGCWLLLDRPLLALHFGVAADLVSMIPTFIKSWRQPTEESKSVFVTSSVAGFFGLLAAVNFGYENILLPLYLVLVNAAVVGLLLLAEAQHKQAKAHLYDRYDDSK